MRGWYKVTVVLPPPPSRVTIAIMTLERFELFWNVPLPGDPIPVGVLPFLVNDDIPEDEEIA